MDFDHHVRAALADLDQRKLLRDPRAISGPQGPEVIVQGRRVIGLCSNDYLGFASDPRILAAAEAGLHLEGFGAGASRHISGTHSLHLELEQRLAAFLRVPSTLLFSSGYAANLGAIQALAGPGAAIFSDRLNHASLIDGTRVSRAKVFVYEHLDLDHLERLLAAHRSAHGSALVLTESIFSMDGDAPDLTGLRSLCDRYGAGLLVDEAHALGVIGPQGRGLCAAQGVTPDLLIGTLGKAFGCSGAFAAGAAPTIRLLENRARSYVFSTAPPPSSAAAARTAVDLVEAADDRRDALAAHASRLRTSLSSFGLCIPPGEAPIIPVVLGSPQRTMTMSAALLEHGVFVHGVRPPTVPEGGSRLRVVPMASHTRAQIDHAIEAFQRCMTPL